MSRKLFVNLCYIFVRRKTFHQLPSTFHTAKRPLLTIHAARKVSLKVHQLSVLSGELPSTFVNFSCSRETFRELLAPSGELLSAFCATRGISVNFYVAKRPSINILCGRDIFRQFPSTFRAAKRPSIIFPCNGRPSVNFHQVFVWPGALL